MTTKPSDPGHLSIRASFLQVAGLSAIAIALPLVLPAVLSAPVILARLASRSFALRFQAWWQGGVVTLIALPIVERIPGAGGWGTLVVSAAVGLMFTVSFLRSSSLR